MAWATGLAVGELMLVYVIQSIIIGVTSFIRIVTLGRFDPGSVRMGGRSLEESAAAKWQLAMFFALHYGVFHFVYLVFAAIAARDALPGAIGTYLLCALVFAVNHGYSLAQNRRRDAAGRPKIGTIMMLPYARIVPMHIVILMGGTLVDDGAAAFVVFGVLKTAADVLMHVVEHRVLHKAGDQG